MRAFLVAALLLATVAADGSSDATSLLQTTRPIPQSTADQHRNAELLGAALSASHVERIPLEEALRVGQRAAAMSLANQGLIMAVGAEHEEALRQESRASADGEQDEEEIEMEPSMVMARAPMAQMAQIDALRAAAQEHSRMTKDHLKTLESDHRAVGKRIEARLDALTAEHEAMQNEEALARGISSMVERDMEDAAREEIAAMLEEELEDGLDEEVEQPVLIIEEDLPDNDGEFDEEAPDASDSNDDSEPATPATESHIDADQPSEKAPEGVAGMLVKAKNQAVDFLSKLFAS